MFNRIILTILTILALSTPVWAQQAVNTEFPTATQTADNITDPTVPGVRSYGYCYSNASSDWLRCRNTLIGVYNATPPTFVDGDEGELQINASGALIVTGSVTLGSAIPTGTNSIGQITANAGTNLNTSALALESGGNLAAAVASLSSMEADIAALNSTGININQIGGSSPTPDITSDFDSGAGSQVRAAIGLAAPASGGAVIIPGDATNGLDVDVTRLPTQADHDATDVAATLGVGGRAIAHGANPSPVAAGDRTANYSNRAGIPFVIGGHPNVQSLEAYVTDSDGAQAGAAIVTVGSGAKAVITMVAMNCDGSNTGPVNALVAFSTSTTLPTRAAAGTAGIIAAFDGIPAGGGKVKGSGAGIIAIGADGEDVRITMEDPAGGSCSVEVSYYTIES